MTKTKKDVCKHCGQPIRHIETLDYGKIWVHDDPDEDPAADDYGWIKCCGVPASDAEPRGALFSVFVPDTAEYDVRIVLPGGREWLLQYRNYEGEDLGTCEGATVDICLDAVHEVVNWKNAGMDPAQAVKGQPHMRKADQICVVL